MARSLRNAGCGSRGQRSPRRGTYGPIRTPSPVPPSIGPTLARCSAVVLESHGAELKEARAVHRGGRACWLSGGARRQIARQPRCQYPKNRSMLLCHNSITRTSTSHGHYCSGHQRCRRHSVARCRPVANIAGPTDDEAGAGPVRPADAVGSFAALDPGRRSQAGHEKATSRRRGSPGLVVDHGKSAALKVRQAFSHGVKLLG